MPPAKKPSKKPLALSRSSVVLLCGIVFLGMAAMFGLGHYAGRRQGPVMYDYEDMRDQFVGIKNALATIEISRGRQRGRPTDLTKEAGDNSEEHLLYTPSEASARDYTPLSVSGVIQPAAKVLAELIAAKSSKPGESKTGPEKSETTGAEAGAATPGASESLAMWTVQVATVTSADEAGELVKRLSNKGYPAWSTVVTRPGKKDLHRVRVGRYGNRTQADMVRKALLDTASTSLVVKME